MIIQVCPGFLTKCKSLSVSKYLFKEVKLKTCFFSLSLGRTGKNIGQEQDTCTSHYKVFSRSRVEHVVNKGFSYISPDMLKEKLLSSSAEAKGISLSLSPFVQISYFCGCYRKLLLELISSKFSSPSPNKSLIPSIPSCLF